MLGDDHERLPRYPCQSVAQESQLLFSQFADIAAASFREDVVEDDEMDRSVVESVGVGSESLVVADNGPDAVHIPVVVARKCPREHRQFVGQLLEEREQRAVVVYQIAQEKRKGQVAALRQFREESACGISRFGRVAELHVAHGSDTEAIGLSAAHQPEIGIAACRTVGEVSEPGVGDPAARKFVAGRKNGKYAAGLRCREVVAAFPVGKNDRIPVGHGNAFQGGLAFVPDAVTVAVEEECSRTHGLCDGLRRRCDHPLCQKRQRQKDGNRFHK